MYHLSKDQISVAINPITTWDLIYPRSEQTGHPHPVLDTWVIPTNQPLLVIYFLKNGRPGTTGCEKAVGASGSQ